MIRAIVQRLPFAPLGLVKLGIVGGMLIAGILTGRMAVRLRQPEILVVISLLPAAGLVLLRHGRLEHGILVIVFTAAVVRFTIPTGTQTRIVISLVVTAGVIGLWLLGTLVNKQKLRLTAVPANVPLLGFVITCFVSYVWSNAFRDLLVVVWSSWPLVQLGGLAVMILLPGALLFTANVLKEVRWLEYLTILFLIIGTVAIAGDYLGLPVSFLQVRPLFPTWFICLGVALALFDTRLPLWVRGLLLGLVAAWFHRVFILQLRWLSAWMPTITAMGVIIARRSKLLTALMVAALVVGVILNLSYFEARFDEESQASGVTRLAAYANNWRVTGKHLLFGVGPAGYAVYYMSYFPLEAMATHSTYLDILSQTGIVGLGFYLWLYAALGVMAWRLVIKVRGRGDFTEAISVAALGGLAGIIVASGLGDWLMPFVYTQTIAGFDYAIYSWIWLGAMAALYSIINNQEAKDDSAVIVPTA